MGSIYKNEFSRKFEIFKGTHYEMGIRQGQIYAENLKHGLEIIRNHEGINQLRPKIMPKGLFLKMASRKALKTMEKLFDKYIPNQAERINGIAEGSLIPKGFIYLLLSAEIILGEPNYEIPLKKGCTCVGYKDSKTSRSAPMVSRNFDFEKFVLDILCLRKNEPSGNKYKTWDLSATPLPGTFNGLNEKGLFIATDEAFPTGEVDVGLPASAIIQETLENCSTSEEAFEFIKNLPRGSGNVYCVNDHDGNIMAIEYTSRRIYKRMPKNDENFIITTNHYLRPELKDIDLPIEAVFSKKEPKFLWGQPVNETSYIRMDTANRILKGKELFDLEDMMRLHRDHSADPAKKGNFNTLCHHDPVNITAASMIFDLHSFDAWICIGLPCQNEYKHFDLKQI